MLSGYYLPALNIYPSVCIILPSLQVDPGIASGRMGWSTQNSFGNSGGPHPCCKNHMLDDPSKSSGEITDGLILPLEDGLQGADVSLL